MRGAVLLAALLLGACSGDVPNPVSGPAPGSYRGAIDQKPWDSAPNSWSNSTWTPGDRASWESALRQRAQFQSELTRTNR